MQSSLYSGTVQHRNRRQSYSWQCKLPQDCEQRCTHMGQELLLCHAPDLHSSCMIIFTPRLQRHTSLAGRDADELTRMHVCREQCRARSNSQPCAGRLLTLCYMIHTSLSDPRCVHCASCRCLAGGSCATLSSLCNGQLARCCEGPESCHLDLVKHVDKRAIDLHTAQGLAGCAAGALLHSSTPVAVRATKFFLGQDDLEEDEDADEDEGGLDVATPSKADVYKANNKVRWAFVQAALCTFVQCEVGTSLNSACLWYA